MHEKLVSYKGIRGAHIQSGVFPKLEDFPYRIVIIINIFIRQIICQLDRQTIQGVAAVPTAAVPAKLGQPCT